MADPVLLACATALPEHYYTQDDLLQSLAEFWRRQHYNQDRLQQLHQALGITGRYLALPKEEYARAPDFTERNRRFNEISLVLAEEAVLGALRAAELRADQLEYLVFTTVTGLAVPSLDAQLMNRLPLSPALKRLPIFGWGCLGGAAGTARLHDLLRGSGYGMLLSVELCSLTLQADDLSVANLVASGLFGDGAAALVMGPGQGPRVLATRSVFFPNSQEVMGWDVGGHGFSIVLSPQVATYAEQHLAPALLAFLAEFELTPADIGAWIAHPGGPKVIDALERALRLQTGALDVTRRSLASIGNLSSASVLFVLQEVLQQTHPPGTYGLMLAMGPAFCAEVLLLQW